nr:CvpA family protein [bacterium]
MNIIDLVFIGVLALFIIIGAYRGFLRSLLNIAAIVLAVVLALCLRPGVSKFLVEKTGLYEQILYFTEGGQIINNTELATRDVATLSEEETDRILTSTGLPSAIVKPLKDNVLKSSFDRLGVSTLAEYINHTLANMVINIIAFLGVFVIASIALALVVGALDQVLKLPVLRHLDGLLGALAGLIVGLLVLMAAYVALPVLQSVLPVEKLATMIAESKSAAILEDINFLVSGVLKGLVAGGKFTLPAGPMPTPIITPPASALPLVPTPVPTPPPAM